MPLTNEEIDALDGPSEAPQVPVGGTFSFTRGYHADPYSEEAIADQFRASREAAHQSRELHPLTHPQDIPTVLARGVERGVTRPLKALLQDIPEVVIPPTNAEGDSEYVPFRNAKAVSEQPVRDYLYGKLSEQDTRTPQEQDLDTAGVSGVARGLHRGASSAPDLALKILATRGLAGAGASTLRQGLANAAVFGQTEEGFSPKQAAVLGLLPGVTKVFTGPAAEATAGALAKAGVITSPGAYNLAKTSIESALDYAYFIAPDAAEIAKMTPEKRAEFLTSNAATILAMKFPELAAHGIDFAANDTRGFLREAVKSHLLDKLANQEAELGLKPEGEGEQFRTGYDPRNVRSESFRAQRLPSDNLLTWPGGTIPEEAPKEELPNLPQAAPPELARMVNAGVKILVRRGVDPELALEFSQRFAPTSGHDATSEEFRSDLNKAFDAAGFKVNKEVNQYSGDHDRLVNSGLTPDEASEHVAKHNQVKQDINDSNLAALLNLKESGPVIHAGWPEKPTESNALQKPGAEPLLQRQPEQAPPKGSERGPVEPGVEGQKDTPPEEQAAPVAYTPPNRDYLNRSPMLQGRMRAAVGGYRIYRPNRDYLQRSPMLQGRMAQALGVNRVRAAAPTPSAAPVKKKAIIEVQPAAPPKPKPDPLAGKLGAARVAARIKADVAPPAEPVPTAPVIESEVARAVREAGSLDKAIAHNTVEAALARKTAPETVAELERLGAELQKAKVAGRNTLEKLEDWADHIIRQGRLGTLGLLDPELMAAYVVKGVALITGKVVDGFTSFSKKMIELFGEKLSPFIKRIWDNALVELQRIAHGKQIEIKPDIGLAVSKLKEGSTDLVSKENRQYHRDVADSYLETLRSVVQDIFRNPQDRAHFIELARWIVPKPEELLTEQTSLNSLAYSVQDSVKPGSQQPPYRTPTLDYLRNSRGGKELFQLAKRTWEIHPGYDDQGKFLPVLGAEQKARGHEVVSRVQRDATDEVAYAEIQKRFGTRFDGHELHGMLTDPQTWEEYAQDFYKEAPDLAYYIDSTVFKKTPSELDERVPVIIQSIADNAPKKFKTEPSAMTRLDAWAQNIIRESKSRLFTGLDPQLLAAYAVRGVFHFGELARAGAVKAADWARRMVEELGEQVKPYLAEVWKMSNPELAAGPTNPNTPLGKAMALLEQARTQSQDQTDLAAENLAVQQSASIFPQVQSVQAFVAKLGAETQSRNVPGVTILTGPALTRQRVYDRLSSLPVIRSFFVQPVHDLDRSVQVMNGVVAKWQDPSLTPEQRSHAALIASQTMDNFFESTRSFLGDVDEKLERAMRGLLTVTDEKEEAEGKRDLASLLKKQLLEMGHGYSAAVSAADGRAFLDYAGGDSYKNLLRFIQQHVPLGPIQDGSIKTADDFYHYLLSMVKPVQGDKTVGEVLGATEDALQVFSRVFMQDQALVESLAHAKDLLTAKSLDAPLAKIKTALADLVKDQKWTQALDLFAKGVGNNEAERKQSMAAANLFKAKQRGLIVDIQALLEAKQLLADTTADPEFKALVAQVYGETAEANVIRTNEVSHVELKPVYPGDKPSRLELSPTGSMAAGNLEVLRNYIDLANLYLGDTELPGWDQAHANGLKAFVERYKIWLDPAVNPLASKNRDSLYTRTSKLLSFQIPIFALKSHAGEAAESANRSRTNYSSIQELAIALYKEHEFKMNVAEKAALKSHGWGAMDLTKYEDRIWGRLAGSRQSFANLGRLKVGDPVGNGDYQITAEDIAFLKAVRAFQGDAIRTSLGQGKRELTGILAEPSKILFKVGKDLRSRNPMESGPDTLSRRFSRQMAFWAQDWFYRSDENRIQLINRNPDRLLMGYVEDASNGEYVGTYAFKPELQDILRDANSRVSSVKSFGDLVDKVYNRRLASGVDLPEDFSVESVRKQILDEFHGAFDRYQKEVESTGQLSQKYEASGFGGDNSFNTERGKQLLPAAWYDYGVLDTGDRLSYLHSMIQPFAIRHLRDVQALSRALGFATEAIGREGDADYWYKQGEIAKAKAEIARYQENLEAAMERSDQPGNTPTKLGAVSPETGPPGAFDAMPRMYEQIATGYNTILSSYFRYMVSSMLTGPQANAFNSSGGYFNIAAFNLAVRNFSLAKVGGQVITKTIPRIARELVHLAIHPNTAHGAAVRSVLRSAESTAFIGQMAESIGRFIDAQRNLYQQSADLGMNLNLNLLDMLHGRILFARTGGNPRRMGTGRLAGYATTALNVGAESLKYGTVGFVDSRLNTEGIGMAQDLERDLKNRAILYGQVREARGGSDISQVDFRFTDAELVGGRLGLGNKENAAGRLRDLLRREGGVNVDAEMVDFYRDYQAAKAENPNVDIDAIELFTKPQHNQIALAISQDVNQATFSTRPIFFRGMRGASALGLFLGYPAYEIHKLASYFDRRSNTDWGRNFIQHLPTALSLVGMAAIIGATGVVITDEVKKRLMNSRSAYKNILEVKNPMEAMAVLRSGAGSIWSGLGTVINQLTGYAFRTGFDINNVIVPISMIQDFQRTARLMFQTKDSWKDPYFYVPLANMAFRYMFPGKYVSSQIEMLSGSNQVRNWTNDVRAGARGGVGGTELKPPTGGDFQAGKFYTALSHFKNAVGNGNLPDAKRAYLDMIQIAKDNKMPDPERAAQRSIQQSHPLNALFAQKPTEAQWQAVMQNISPERQAEVAAGMKNFDQAFEMLGIKPFAFKSEGGGGVLAASSGGGGGGGGGSVRGLPVPRSSGGGFSLGGSGVRLSGGGGLRRLPVSRLRTRLSRSSGRQRLASGPQVRQLSLGSRRRVSLNKLRSAVTFKKG